MMPVEFALIRHVSDHFFSYFGVTFPTNATWHAKWLGSEFQRGSKPRQNVWQDNLENAPWKEILLIPITGFYRILPWVAPLPRSPITIRMNLFFIGELFYLVKWNHISPSPRLPFLDPGVTFPLLFTTIWGPKNSCEVAMKLDHFRNPSLFLGFPCTPLILSESHTPVKITHLIIFLTIFWGVHSLHFMTIGFFRPSLLRIWFAVCFSSTHPGCEIDQSCEPFYGQEACGVDFSPVKIQGNLKNSFCLVRLTLNSPKLDI